MYSPKKLEDIKNNITIVITSVFVKEIFEYLDGQGYEKDILSARCFRLGIHFDIMRNSANQYLDAEVIERYKLEYSVWSRIIRQCEDFPVIYANNQKAVSEFPVVILLHGIQKTGNSTLVKSFKKTANAVVTTHQVYGDEASLREWNEVMRIFAKHEIRIITGIRRPMEREISAMWQSIHRPFKYHDVCFNTVMDEYSYAMEEWFDRQLKEAFGIDIFSEPFDKEKGYTVIKRENVSVFVYRLDFLSSLEKELGEFAGVEDFKIQKANLADEKTYAFAYRSFLEQIRLERDYFEESTNSRIMTHFYTLKEREKYRQKWEGKIV